MHQIFKSNLIAKFLDGKHVGEIINVNNFTSLLLAKQNSISFYNDLKFREDLLKTKAGIVILKDCDLSLRKGPSIVVDDPYLAFAKISNFFLRKEKKEFIHPNSIISKETILGKDIYIGPFTVIGKNCTISDKSEIEANVTIEDNVVIGKNVKIHPGVTIHCGVIIGDNSEIFSGAKIGTDGFGYAKDHDKKWIKIPQTGSVKVGDNVDIGANTTIDRGAIDDTVIHSGVKIDNQVQIGHNCVIGENTIIAGCTGIAGSAKIGKNCMIGGASMIKGHIEIADDTVISGGSSIGKNVNEPGKRFTNIFPYNIEHKDWLRIANNLKKIGKKND
jgi:UDP-3-O-[3-hydroxymyristoyl] glucosamine N-acyltransferase